jgi:hypothetical protein
VRVINSLDELLHLPRDSRVNGFGVRSPVRLEIPDAPRHALIRAQESLNALRSRCGCVAGGIATSMTLVGAVVLAVQHNAWFSLGLLGDIALGVFAAFTAGLVAKLATLLVTRWQFASRCRAHHRHLIRGPDVHVHAMGR